MISRLQDQIGRLAARLEAYPNVWAAARRFHNILSRTLGRVGIEVPRHTPGGLRELRRLLANDNDGSLRDKDGPLILFVSPRGWSTAVLVDVLLAQAMRLRGARVVIWSCGTRMPICHMTNSTEAPPMPCMSCIRLQDDLLDPSNLRRVTTSEYCDDTAIAKIRNEIEAIDSDDIAQWRFRGFGLGHIAQLSASWFLRSSLTHGHEFGERAIRDYMLLGATTLLAAERVFLDVEPDLVVMLNGVFTEENVVRQVAISKEVPYITYERAFGYHHFVFSRNKLVNHFDLSEHWPSVASQALDDRQSSELDDFLRNWRGGVGAVVKYWNKPEERDSVIRRELRIPEQARVIALFTNVVWDTAAFDRDVGFASMWDWIETTVDWVQSRADTHLVIRIHPGEIRMKGWESEDRVMDRLQRAFPNMPSNVSVVAPESELSSYRLIEFADTVLVYTSTIGIEAAISGRRVVVGGDTHYRAKGFTLDPANRLEYLALLGRNRELGEPNADEIRQLARRYAYLFFLRFMLPLPLFSERRMGNPHLTFDSLEALMPGATPDLDRICNFIRDSVADHSPLALIAGTADA